jgi:hypothetical protein
VSRGWYNDVMLMAVGEWSACFAGRVGQHADVEVVRVDGLSDEGRKALARSLSTFQLGESGTGEHLIAVARSASGSDDYVAALARFVGEEQQHARLLGLVLTAVGHPFRDESLERHGVRSRSPTQVGPLRYYSALRDGIESSDLVEVFGRIHADEVVHVEFHAQTLPPQLLTWPRSVRAAVRLLRNTLVTGTSVLVALDHRRALRLVGVDTSQFVCASDSGTYPTRFGPRSDR